MLRNIAVERHSRESWQHGGYAAQSEIWQISSRKPAGKKFVGDYAR